MSGLNHLRRLLRRLEPGSRTHATRARLTQPLLTGAEVSELLQQARRLARSAPTLDSAHPLSGELPSRFRGSGSDYDDNRPYVAGDDLRHLNWRLLARTGQAHTWLYRDERRPAAFHLVDRRAGMIFGTRRRLKVTQAARAAIVRAAAAQHLGLPVGGMVLEAALPTARWLPIGQDHALHALIEAVRAPCPPREGSQPSLARALRHLLAVLPVGSRLDVFSDFHDLDTTIRPILHALAARHRVSAFLVLDPAEVQLPRAGQLYLRETGGHLQQRIDTSDPTLRRQFQDAAAVRHARLADWCRGAGVVLHTLSTDTDDLQALLDTPPNPALSRTAQRRPRTGT